MSPLTDQLRQSLTGLEPGSVYFWKDLSERFGFKENYFQTAGGMLYWKKLNLLLIVTHPEGGKSHNYRDRWDPETGHLLYVGRGLSGDQKMTSSNKRLKENNFSAACVLKAAGPRRFIYLGLARNVGQPQVETAPGKDGSPRKQFRFRLRIDAPRFEDQDELWNQPESSDYSMSEGGIKKKWTTYRERNPKIRSACIDHWGCRCVVCNISFGEHYGDIGHGFIHVHHLVPISDSDEPRDVDPIKDLRPVCPNCHSMIHRRRPPLQIEEARKLLQRPGTD